MQTRIETQLGDPQRKPFREIKHFDTIKEAFGALFSGEKEFEEPFIVSNSKEFAHLSVEALASVFTQEKDVMCWFETKDVMFNDAEKSGEYLYDSWKQDQLAFNVVDAPNKHLNLLPKILYDNAFNNMSEVGQEYAICYSLTKANNLTPYHTDKYAQGWVYLTCGTKEWHIFSAKDVEFLAKHGYPLEALRGMEFNDLVRILDNYLWGKIFVGTITGGDIIYFPHLWAHRVYTYDKSFGLCGYNSTRDIKV